MGYASDVAFVDAEADGSRKDNADKTGCGDDEDDGARGGHVWCLTLTAIGRREQPIDEPPWSRRNRPLLVTG
jgi:hypothetical protein